MLVVRAFEKGTSGAQCHTTVLYFDQTETRQTTPSFQRTRVRNGSKPTNIEHNNVYLDEDIPTYVRTLMLQ